MASEEIGWKYDVVANPIFVVIGKGNSIVF